MMKTTLKNLKVTVLPLFIFIASFSWSQSEAIYNITVTTTWNAGDHTSVPGSAHWSDLIGATHSTPNRFMSIGTLATTGIKNVAEFGNNSALRGEINDAINITGDANLLLEDINGFVPFGPIGTSGFTNITVSDNFPLVSLVSMVAPSPDWFIAVNSENLRSGNPGLLNGWKDDFTIDVFAYDSGTDDGVNYSSINNPSTPFVPISMVSGTPINGVKMATVFFDYQSSTLSTDDLNVLDGVKVYPNPVADILTVANTRNLIESAELYNVLGKRIYTTASVSNNDLKIDIRSLQSGIYILKLNSLEGETASRKVVIE